MLSIFDPFRDITMGAVFLRMTLAVICGGIIGLEREIKRRPAGFRTHILVCLGACMTTLTSQYLYLYMQYFTDMARLGAQVVAGIGFIGAGTIITQRERVKGLTTAAGLWSSAIVGLAAGSGFYEGTIIATVLIEISQVLLVRVERRVNRRLQDVSIYMEYSGFDSLEHAMLYLSNRSIKIMNLEVSRPKQTRLYNTSALVTIHLGRGRQIEPIISDLLDIDGMIVAEEIS